MKEICLDAKIGHAMPFSGLKTENKKWENKDAAMPIKCPICHIEDPSNLEFCEEIQEILSRIAMFHSEIQILLVKSEFPLSRDYVGSE